MSSIQDHSSSVGKLFKLGMPPKLRTWVVYSSEYAFRVGGSVGRLFVTTPDVWVVFLAAGRRNETIHLLFDDGSAGWIHGAALSHLTSVESSNL